MRISDWSSDVCSSDLELDSGNLAGELAIGTCSGHLVARHRPSDNAVERRSVEVLVHEHTTAPIGDAEITDHATELVAIPRLALWTTDRKRVGSGKRWLVRDDSGSRRIFKKQINLK